MRIAIIGGGLTGLTLAYYLQKAGVAYDLFEAGERAGGNLHSPLPPAGYQLEAGPNSLLLSPELDELSDRAGPGRPDSGGGSGEPAPLRAARRRVPGAAGLAAGAAGQLFFSWKTKLAAAGRAATPPYPPVPGETVAAFFEPALRARSGAVRREPVRGGHLRRRPGRAAALAHLSAASGAGAQHGSLLRGLAKGPKATRRRTITLRGGVRTLTDALAARLTNYRSEAAVTTVNQLAVNEYLN
ncbi:MAG: FAD-dependent oxidoreductase [Hymenobacter sp.]